MNILTTVLTVLGVGFLVANARLLLQCVRFRKRQKAALLVWPNPKPPHYGMALAIGVLLGFIVFYKLVLSHQPAFGESMMFLYYAYLLPLSQRIGRGFYQDGIWADAGFIRWDEVGGITWREGSHAAALVVISRLKNFARVLPVPIEHYGAARRLLRDKIGEHAIQFAGTGLELSGHDEREDT
ncbi:MAG: hypothetical protein FJW27_14275 [Acidimicrobiia bacterium]|nr:hypothetical protein [Acidimicrobiia bacterium]